MPCPITPTWHVQRKSLRYGWFTNLEYFGHVQLCQNTSNRYLWISLLLLRMPTHTKNLISTFFRYYDLSFWSTMTIPNHTRRQPTDIYESVCCFYDFLSTYKNPQHTATHSWDRNFKESCNLIGQNHFGP